jgi:hypothetical protein
MEKSIKKIAKMYLNNLSDNEIHTLAYNDIENNDELEDPTMFDAAKVASKLDKIAELYENDKEKESKDSESFEDED